ncbi:LysR family transcriptional regulator [Rossellomorea aquimaris]|uniref:LysR family transcriptional regulator n=1 Tax=Rossellomorea aquimaris TaxID=189382 RepID=UPI001CD3A6E5|nr:LysR family transcriptional regulator [Rossellomorea aquimaris]MCA1054367.1 LysR family transcriptional regulator [Rossellomorea aquimaris]
MELNWIRTFVTLAHFQHFTKTSEFLNLSQPTVSVHIKKLEESLGVKLIDRSSPHIPFTLTPAGQKVFAEGQKMMEIWKSMEHSGDEQDEILLRIGSTHTVSAALLPDFVKKIKILYPHVRLQIKVHNHDGIVELLENHELDLAIVEGTRGIEPFQTEIISRDELRFFAKRGMTLHSSPLILREEGSGTRDYAEQFIKSEQINPAEIIEAGSHHLIKQLALRGLGIAFLSSSMVKEEVANGTLFPIDPYVIHRPFYAVCPADSRAEEMIKEMIGMLKENL